MTSHFTYLKRQNIVVIIFILFVYIIRTLNLCPEALFACDTLNNWQNFESSPKLNVHKFREPLWCLVIIAARFEANFSKGNKYKFGLDILVASANGIAPGIQLENET
jgi:hypothetical protein